MLDAVFISRVISRRHSRNIASNQIARYLRLRALNDLFDLRDMLVFIRKTAASLLDRLGPLTDRHRATSSVCACVAEWHRANTTWRLNCGAQSNNCPDEISEATLTTAAYIGNIALVRVLLQEGCKANSASIYLGPSLCHASKQGHVDIVRLLMEAGADVNATETVLRSDRRHERWGALAGACRTGQDKVIRLLFEPRFNMCTSGNDYQDAIIVSAQCNRLDLVELLIEKSTLDNPLLHSVRERILYRACERGSIDVARALLNQGLDPNFDLDHDLSRRTTQTPLGAAAQHGHAPMVEVLLSQGAKPNIGRPDPLYRAAKGGHLSCMKLLLDAGADIHGNSRSGSRQIGPLQTAAAKGQVEAMRFLLNRGIDLDGYHRGKVALMLACRGGYEDEVRLLSSHAVDLHSGWEFWSPPMHQAMVYGRHNIVRTLFELGVAAIDPLKTKYATQFETGYNPLRIWE